MSRLSPLSLSALALSAFALLTGCDPYDAEYPTDEVGEDDGEDDGEDEEALPPVCPGIGPLACEEGLCAASRTTAEFLAAVDAELEQRGLDDTIHLGALDEFGTGGVATYEILVANYWVSFGLEVPEVFDAEAVSGLVDAVIGAASPDEALSFDEVDQIALDCHAEQAELDPVPDFDGLSCLDLRLSASTVEAHRRVQQHTGNENYLSFGVTVDVVTGELLLCESDHHDYGDDSGEGE